MLHPPVVLQHPKQMNKHSRKSCCTADRVISPLSSSSFFSLCLRKVCLTWLCSPVSSPNSCECSECIALCPQHFKSTQLCWLTCISSGGQSQTHQSEHQQTRLRNLQRTLHSLHLSLPLSLSLHSQGVELEKYRALGMLSSGSIGLFCCVDWRQVDNKDMTGLLQEKESGWWIWLRKTANKLH